MRNIKLTIEYNGSKFCGWQIQKQGERTVQGEIEKALLKIIQEDVKVIGSGRTDSGVHALGQVANFKMNSKLPVYKIIRALNRYLPKDITIIDAQEVDNQFHAQHSAKGKVYQYRVYCREFINPLSPKNVFHYPYKLNVAAMQREAKSLIGKNDFCSFAATEALKRVSSTVRNLKRVDIKREKNNLIIFELEADGFLYKMVRNIVGTLIEVGSGLKSEGCVNKILKKRERNAAGATAQPEGLTLIKVIY